MTRTLLIVDDHASFRQFIGSMLASDGFEIAGEAPDGETGVMEAERLQPDVVLLDVQLPGIDGFEVARKLAEGDQPPMVVLTSSRAASDYGTRLTEAPIRGFISKHELSADGLEELLD